MEAKKISFGFMKTKKPDKPLAAVNDEVREYIECVEEKSIKVVGGEEVKTHKPLVIPMKPNTLVTAERLKEIAAKVESAIEEPEIKQEPTDDTVTQETVPDNETLEQMAVRELMQESKKEVKTEINTLAIPASTTKTVLTGEKESTLDDYDAVPIQDFGMAMLRGMGWTAAKDGSKYKQPELRPKGLGLGADKVVKESKSRHAYRDNIIEELAILKNSYVKINFGKYAGYYGKVVSLDEENGRVVVDIPIKKETVSLSEFMMKAVTKTEYDRESKVINADSYEEYKKKELVNKSSRDEEKSSSSQRRDEKEKEKRDRQRETDNIEHRRERDQESNGRGRNKRRDSSSSEDRSRIKRKKEKKRYSSSDSLSSLSEDERRPTKHSKHKSRRRRSRSKSESRKRSRTPEGKRDIDKKRKGKKKKRDRDRSPNYKKHRK